MKHQLVTLFALLLMTNNLYAAKGGGRTTSKASTSITSSTSTLSACSINYSASGQKSYTTSDGNTTNTLQVLWGASPIYTPDTTYTVKYGSHNLSGQISISATSHIVDMGRSAESVIFTASGGVGPYKFSMLQDGTALQKEATSSLNAYNGNLTTLTSDSAMFKALGCTTSIDQTNLQYVVATDSLGNKSISPIVVKSANYSSSFPVVTEISSYRVKPGDIVRLKGSGLGLYLSGGAMRTLKVSFTDKDLRNSNSGNYSNYYDGMIKILQSTDDTLDIQIPLCARNGKLTMWVAKPNYDSGSCITIGGNYIPIAFEVEGGLAD